MKKINLSKQTLRVLTANEVGQVAGAAISNPIGCVPVPQTRLNCPPESRVIICPAPSRVRPCPITQGPELCPL